MNTIYIKVKNIYGNMNAYPDCETGKLFAQLTGKKTFSTTDMQTMQKLGFEVRFSKQVNTIEELIRA
jgi:hypothetical protein